MVQCLRLLSFVPEGQWALGRGPFESPLEGDVPKKRKEEEEEEEGLQWKRRQEEEEEGSW